jgi:hypothetical protein
MTTDQLLGIMMSEHLDEQHIDMVRSFLQPSDLVKFAKYIPENDEIQQTTQLAFEYIQKTKFVIEESAVSEKQEATEQPVPEVQITEETR